MRGHLIVDLPLLAIAAGLYPSFGLAPLPWLGASSLVIHSIAVVHPRCSLYLPVWWEVPGSKLCALTYDDGPNPEVTPALLDLLGAVRQHATFFVIGEHVRRHPHLVRRMVAEGHAIGLHSYSHSRWFNCWGPSRILRDLENCGKSIEDAAGISAPRLFRPPVGLKNPFVALACNRMQLRAVTWTARAFDSTAQPSPALALKRVMKALRPGGICTMHDGYEPLRPAIRSTSLEATRLALQHLEKLNLRSEGLRYVLDGVEIGESTSSGT